MCSRLVRNLQNVRSAFPDYHAKPVAPFGGPDSKLLIVGLAPGLHGANRTGRPFTGDYAGILLYETLYCFGFASQSTATGRDDGLRLIDCRVTNAVKCLPPQNKPAPDEIRRCNAYLRHEIGGLPQGAVILALGVIAHRAVLMALDLRYADYPFTHGARHALRCGRALYDSYHCSRYNTQTKRLTPEMFRDVVAAISRHLRAGQ
jgi:uracil-DNA glycosylase family 4